MKGIFYNSKKSYCSIHESGLMCYNALKKSNIYNIEYCEDSKYDQIYDFAVFNQHMIVNNWIDESIIKKMNCKTFCIVLEVGDENNIMPWTPQIFNHYMIIDPTIKEYNNVHAFPRPIEDYDNKNIENNIPIIGSFGFATVGKNWNQIVEQTNKEFEEAVVKINLPEATYIPNSKEINRQTVENIMSVSRKKTIKIEITHEYMNKKELIEWCAKNTINFFPYYRNMYGLAAVTDQAIAAGKPILTTDNKTFRHILQYIKPFPEIGIKQAIEINGKSVLKMKENWSTSNFVKKFENIL